MHLDAIKEPFDYHYSSTVLESTVEIEKHERFAKAGWKLVLRLTDSRNPSRISHQNSALIADGNDDSTLHAAFSRIEADAEIGGADRVHATRGEIRMALVNAS